MKLTWNSRIESLFNLNLGEEFRHVFDNSWFHRVSRSRTLADALTRWDLMRAKPRLNEKQEVYLVIIECERHSETRVASSRGPSKNVTIHVLPRCTILAEMSAKPKRWTESHICRRRFLSMEIINVLSHLELTEHQVAHPAWEYTSVSVSFPLL